MSDFRYHRFPSKYWTDPDFRALSDDAKLLLFYGRTSQHTNILGCFVLPKAYLTDDLGWTPERLAEPFAELLANGYFSYDDQARLLLIPALIEEDGLDNENQGKAAAKVLAELPKSPLLSDLKRLVERLGKPFLEPLLKQFAELLGEPVPVPVPGPVPGSVDGFASPEVEAGIRTGGGRNRYGKH